MFPSGSLADEEVIRVYSFDGETVYLDQKTPLLHAGNFLGGGAAGTVYEAEHCGTHEHFALKILNPIGYKMVTPALLRKCTVVVKGKVFNDAVSLTGEEAPTRQHVWWLVNGSTKQYIGAYYSEKQNCLKELSLNQCITIYGAEPPGVGEDDSGEGDATVEIVQQIGGGPRIYVPSVPPKYSDFVRRRSRIFREIRNMRKISTHANVIRLEGVLELTQETKCTIFLIMELANGGELFDRIKIDCGTREDTAKFFFQQLLEGVRHCHDQGVCHRDLKPENLLLQDCSETGTTLKIADFGFSARFAMDSGPGSDDRQQEVIARYQQSVVHSGLTPSTPSMLEDSPLRMLKSVVGSPFYVAPEVLQARGYDGPRADVWSLGVILYAMLAGNLPFGQELGTCKRFRHFCKWVRDQMIKSNRFWEDPKLEFPPWLFPAKFSTMAKGLIVSMLHPDPSCRLTVQEAIAHPLCARDDTSTQVSTKLLHSTPAVEMSDLYKNAQAVAVPIVEDAMRVDKAQLTANQSNVVAQAVPVLHLEKGQSSHPTGEDAMNEDTFVEEQAEEEYDDDEGGVFRMEEDGEESYEEPKVTQTMERKAASAPATAHTQASSTAYIFGSPPSQQSMSYSAAPPIAPSLIGSPSIDDLVIADDEFDSSTESASRYKGAEGAANAATSGISNQQAPPSFSDLVKRSTRFITAVPAAEVLDKVHRVLEECRFKKIQTPIGFIGKVELHWDEFRVEVWGQDVNGPPLCALQLFQMPLDSSVPASPFRAGGGVVETVAVAAAAAAGANRQLFLVEFIRGQLEIFSFKRFYQYLRQRFSELIKREYAFALFESGMSPMVDSSMLKHLQQFKD